MEGNDKSQPQSQSQSQRNLIHGDALAAGGDASAYVQQNDPNSPNASGSAVPSATNTKRNLIVVASFAALIIIVVVILAVTHEFPEWSSSDSSHGAYWMDDDTFEAYYWDEYYGNYGGDGWNDFTFQGNVTYYCGGHLDEPSTAHECASECYYSPDGSSISYWFPKTKVCYCEPFTSPYYKQYENITIKWYDLHLFFVSEFLTMSQSVYAVTIHPIQWRNGKCTRLWTGDHIILIRKLRI